MEHYNSIAHRNRRRQQFMQSPLPVLLAGIGIAALSWANLVLLSVYPDVMTWLPSGAGLGLMLLLGARVLPALALGLAAGLLLGGSALVPACANAILDSAACLLAWALLIKTRPMPLDRLSVPTMARLLITSFAVFGLAGYLAAPLAALLHASVAATAAQRILAGPVGVMLMAPLLVWMAQPRQRVAGPHWAGALATFAILGAVTLLVYGGTLEHRFGIADSALLVLPPALWLALRYGTGFTLAGNLMLVLAAGIGTARGYGPFSPESTGLALTFAVLLATTLLVAASRAECCHAEATIARLATHDGLTGVANRRAFSERMEETLDAAARDGRQVALMFIDLTHFKHVNDKRGHQVGDMLLAEAAKRILGCIRSDAMLGRFGDDEFVVMVDHANSHDALSGIAGRIADAVSRPYAIGGHPCQIGCALGISVFPKDGASVAELVRKADAAMYQLKSDGANGYRFYATPREREPAPEVVS